MTICNIKLSLIKMKINKIKLLTGFCQNWVLLSINLKFNFLYIVILRLHIYLNSFKYMPVKLFLVAEVLRYF